MINRILLFLLLSSVTVFAALPPFANAPSQWQNNSQGINYSKNVGIGSSNPGTALDTSGTIRTNSLIAIGNGNTGIGTLNPGQLLDVAGTARVLGFNMPTGAVSGYIMTTNSIGIGTWQPASTGGGGGNVGVGTSGTITFWGSTNTLNSQANFTFNGNNVGIGSANPGTALDAQGTIRSSGIYATTGGTMTLAPSGTTAATITSSGILTTGFGIRNVTNAQSGGLSMNTGVVAWGASTTMDTGLSRTASGTVAVGNGTSGNATGILIAGNIGIGTPTPLAAMDVYGTIRTTAISANTGIYADGNQRLSSETIGSGISLSAGTLSSNAVYQISYQPGLLTAINSTIGVYGKFSKASTVDNIVGSALTFSCVSNPTISLYECGTSSTCTVSPVTIGSVTVTSSGTAFNGTVSNSAITAGDYIGWNMSAGTCASIDISATAQVHSN